MNMTIRTPRRRAATAVETALILLPLLLVSCGIFEYGRFLMHYNLLNNAAREGCRFALANNTDPSINADVQAVVNRYMAGQSADFNNFNVTVTGTHQGVATPVNNLVAGDMITVTVSGQYQFMNVLSLVHVPTTVNLSSAVVMICEGVT
jgi:Flp pilus assembly protein TadG